MNPSEHPSARDPQDESSLSTVSGAPSSGLPHPMTGGALLARNTVWTLLGQSAPLIGAFVAIPILLRDLGTERFGVLTLAWAVIGYVSLFDLGLGRALTQRLAEGLGRGREREGARDAVTALVLLGALGVGSGLILFAIAPWLTTGLLRVPAGLESETILAFRWVAIAVPFVLVTAGLAGILSAHQRFGALNVIRTPTSLLSFLGPLVVVAFSARLDHVVATLAGIRVVGTLAHAMVTARLLRAPGLHAAWNPDAARAMVRMGGWMTASNLISPIMVQMDRFLVGAWSSLAAVAYYATPYEIATRLWIVSAPVVTVLFPAFGTALASDRQRASFLYGRSIHYVWLILCPIVIAMIVLAREGLGLWLGREFADRSTVVLQWLAIGILANSVGQMAYALLHAAGRAKQAALLHTLELVPYLASVWILLQWHGINGVAWAWCGRMTVDAIALLVMARGVLGGALLPPRARWALAAGLGGIAGAFVVQSLPLPLRIAYAVLALATAAGVACSPTMARERQAVMAMIRRPRPVPTGPTGETR